MSDFLFIADQLWLDFVNTELAPAKAHTELLKNPHDLARWLEAAGLHDSTASESLLKDIDTPLGRKFLNEALHFRHHLRAVASSIEKKVRIPDASVDAINQALAASATSRILRRTGKTFELVEQRQPSSLLGLVAPVAQSAAEFLASGKFDRLIKCGNPQCILYVYDATRSHTRQWCSMATCGNRMKVAAFHRRRRVTK